MRIRPALAAIILIGAIIAIAFGISKRTANPLRVKAHFENAEGLRPGAPVDLAGVEVGRVISVRVRPELRDRPAEVIMGLKTSYELEIPDDAVASVETAGVLGQSFVSINVHNAKGPAIRDGGELRTVRSESLTTQQILECLSNLANRQSCDLAHSKIKDSPPEIPPTAEKSKK